MTFETLMEFFHGRQRELVESAALATLLRDPRFLTAFLEAVRCTWPVESPIRTRTEVTITSKCFADIEVAWAAEGVEYYLLVENKPYSWLTDDQPRAYVDSLSKRRTPHLGLAFIYNEDDVKDEWAVRLRRRVPRGRHPAGSRRWEDLQRALRHRSPALHVFKARLHRVAAHLKPLAEGNEDLARIARWYSEQHIDYMVRARKRHRQRFISLIDASSRMAAAREAGLRLTPEWGFFGADLGWAKDGGKDLLVWVGVEPDIAKLLDWSEDTPMAQLTGWASPGQERIVEAASRVGDLEWTLVPSAVRGPTRVAMLNSVAQLEACMDLAAAIKA